MRVCLSILEDMMLQIIVKWLKICNAGNSEFIGGMFCLANGYFEWFLYVLPQPYDFRHTSLSDKYE